jgi:hypothetical protein
LLFYLVGFLITWLLFTWLLGYLVNYLLFPWLLEFLVVSLLSCLVTLLLVYFIAMLRGFLVT